MTFESTLTEIVRKYRENAMAADEARALHSALPVIDCPVSPVAWNDEGKLTNYTLRFPDGNKRFEPNYDSWDEETLRIREAFERIDVKYKYDTCRTYGDDGSKNENLLVSVKLVFHPGFCPRIVNHHPQVRRGSIYPPYWVTDGGIRSINRTEHGLISACLAEGDGFFAAAGIDEERLEEEEINGMTRHFSDFSHSQPMKNAKVKLRFDDDTIKSISIHSRVLGYGILDAFFRHMDYPLLDDLCPKTI